MMTARRNSAAAALALLGMVAATSAAHACSANTVQPGLSTTGSKIVVQPGKSCRIYLNLAGWEVHRISVAQQPRKGTVSIEGNKAYRYTAGRSGGEDSFVMEFDTTEYSWQSGAKLQRTVWRLSRPVEIR
jgi:hypothetical protein